VRSSGEEPWRVAVPAASLAERVAELAQREDSALAAREVGRMAVLVPAERLAEVTAAVAARLPEAGYGSDPDLERRTVVLPVRQAKGLEFDTVLVVDPAAIATARHGENDLYVALTRATQRLGIIDVED
jgi:DNA helicase IV